jgi:hypothetical protein
VAVQPNTTQPARVATCCGLQPYVAVLLEALQHMAIYIYLQHLLCYKAPSRHVSVLLEAGC